MVTSFLGKKSRAAQSYERRGIKLVSAPLSIAEVKELQRVADEKGLALTRCAAMIIRQALAVEVS